MMNQQDVAANVVLLAPESEVVLLVLGESRIREEDLEELSWTLAETTVLYHP